MKIGEARGVSAAQVALAWALERPGITSAVVGGETEAQFRDTIAAAHLALTPEERKTLDDVSALPMIYPYWHQGQFARDRFSEADWALHRGNPYAR